MSRMGRRAPGSYGREGRSATLVFDCTYLTHMQAPIQAIRRCWNAIICAMSGFPV
jgi:hypothetical protein